MLVERLRFRVAKGFVGYFLVLGFYSCFFGGLLVRGEKGFCGGWVGLGFFV